MTSRPDALGLCVPFQGPNWSYIRTMCFFAHTDWEITSSLSLSPPLALSGHRWLARRSTWSGLWFRPSSGTSTLNSERQRRVWTGTAKVRTLKPGLYMAWYSKIWIFPNLLYVFKEHHCLTCTNTLLREKPSSIIITVAKQTINTGRTHGVDEVSVSYCDVKHCFHYVFMQTQRQSS